MLGIKASCLKVKYQNRVQTLTLTESCNGLPLEPLSPVSWVFSVLGNVASSEAAGSTLTVSYTETNTIAKVSKTIYHRI